MDFGFKLGFRVLGSRSAAQVFTKYCVFSAAELRDPSRAAVRSGIQRSMRNLGVERLDLVQFFWSDYNQRNFLQTALYLVELQVGWFVGWFWVVLSRVVFGGCLSSAKMITTQTVFCMIRGS